MTSKIRYFSDFTVGDSIFFTKTFAISDFEAFSHLSGDTNPLHHDLEYSLNTEFGTPIVPFHLIASPLSFVAGMNFPGTSSLYLSHQLRVIKSLQYDTPVIYSARINSISPAQQIIELNVVVFRELDCQPILDGSMIVQARTSEWDNSDAGLIQPNSENSTVLITGAGGEIGSALAMSLARKRIPLLLQARKLNKRVKEIKNLCEQLTSRCDVILGDLRNESHLAALATEIKDNGSIQRIVYAACPPVLCDISDHVAVSYSALETLTSALLPNMLSRQSGKVIFVGTTSMENAPKGWRSYAAGKSMGVNFLQSMNRNYFHYGVQFLTVALGFVKTSFSKDLDVESESTAILPEQAAEEIVKHLEDSQTQNTYIRFDHNGSIPGEYTFNKVEHVESIQPKLMDFPIDSARDGLQYDKNETDIFSQIFDRLFVRILKIPDNIVLNKVELGSFPTWDSLKNIELILAMEGEFSVKISSEEIVQTHTYISLKKLFFTKVNLAVDQLSKFSE